MFYHGLLNVRVRVRVRYGGALWCNILTDVFHKLKCEEKFFREVEFLVKNRLYHNIMQQIRETIYEQIEQ